MSRRSILEYAEAIRGRYGKACKKEKMRILDEFTAATGLHRKAAIRLLNRRGSGVQSKRRGRPRYYGPEAVAGLKTVWEAADRLCSKRLRPFLPEMVRVLKNNSELTLSKQGESELCGMSASTIDRLLRRHRLNGRRRGLSTTKPGTLLKNAIPVRTFSQWDEKKPGFLEVDLVAHCGESTEDFYLTTLSAVDVATGWYEPVAVWGKGQERVRAAVHHVRQRMPMPMLGLDSDNGSEFINRALYDYCQQSQIKFTRSRSYKKNDSCHVEQKNWSVVRRVIGYDRYNSKAAFKALEDVYTLLRLYVNFFQPVQKLIGKKRNGAKVSKVHDVAQTPYQRLLKSGVLTNEKERQLESVYNALNPVKLLKQINDAVRKLWSLADRPQASSTSNTPEQAVG